MEELSTGILAKIMSGVKVSEPILQVIQSKQISAATGKERYRLLLSDGKYQISHAMTSGVGLIEDLSIITVTDYVLNDVTTTQKISKILLITGLKVVGSGSIVGQKIGDPETLSDAVLARLDREVSSSSDSLRATSENSAAQTQRNLSQTVGDSRVISKISSLSPYYNKWVIKARVSNKSPLRTWSNSKGEGKLFSMDLMDDSGEIRLTAFKHLAERYYEYVQVDKVYYFSKCPMKAANKQFNTLKNDYEMTVGNETVIEECHDDDGFVPKVHYNFVPISSIAECAPGDIIDVIAICRDVAPIQKVISRTTNRELTKRDLTLIDLSKTLINLTLWGEQAEQFDGSNKPVILIRGAKVGEYGGGKTLTTIMSSQLKINPDIEEGHKVKGWFDLDGKYTMAINLSDRVDSFDMSTPWMTFKDILDKRLGQSERGDYFQTFATILLVRSENAIYKACPFEQCNKKVVDLENGMYRCEKCNEEVPNFKYRLLVSMNIADFTGNQWVNLFSSDAEKVLGKTAQELGLLMEQDNNAYKACFQEANFKHFIFKCRAKLEAFNDEERLRIAVTNVDPVDYITHNEHLYKSISNLTRIPLK